MEMIMGHEASSRNNLCSISPPHFKEWRGGVLKMRAVANEICSEFPRWKINPVTDEHRTDTNWAAEQYVLVDVSLCPARRVRWPTFQLRSWSATSLNG